MKRVYHGSGIVVGLLMAALVPGMASAQGFGHGPGRGHDGLVPPIARRMISREQMHAVMAADKANLKKLYTEAKAARHQLAQDLIAGKDTASDLQALGTAQNNLLAEKVKLAQTLLSKLSAAQRAQVSQFMAKWSSMEQSQRKQRMELLKQFGGGKGAPVPDPAE